ncbi:DUF3883 domain-containing protein [Niastella populi]|uniref:DUF3883 domain-containing protein n=1 Tax=Niastella populi TaxID=550983 RepID=UPI001A985569|nr:DUF3883 domain-containing protein [Niastella populi]
MNIHQLREAQVSFENSMEKVMEARAPLHEIREQFIRYFTPARINQMQIQDYALGYSKPETGFNFCYGIERQLDGLGRIRGSRAPKFGIYFSSRDQRLLITKKWGAIEEIAFPKIKQAIIDIIAAGNRNDLEAIANNPLSPMFKGKILATYFPDTFLNVFSEEHLNYFLIQFNLDTESLITSDAVYKKRALVDFKNTDAVMQHWSLDLFSYFLYNYYPGRPPKNNQVENDPLARYRLPYFPPNPIPTVVSLNILSPTTPQSNNERRTGGANPDYEAEARELKLLGERGEKIVLDMERKRLKDAGKTRLAAQVEKAKYDYEGYDIYSFEEDGTPKYIEVKTTRANVGKVNFFLSANELRKAMDLANYHVYIVFEILKAQPKVWMIGNPFNPENTNVLKIPVSYKVTINAK